MIFPSPAGMSLTKRSVGGNNLIFPGLGTGKSLNFFLQCRRIIAEDSFAGNFKDQRVIYIFARMGMGAAEIESEG